MRLAEVTLLTSQPGGPPFPNRPAFFLKNRSNHPEYVPALQGGMG